MKMSLGLVTAMPIQESIKLAKEAESAGLQRVWVGEDILHREIFTYLAILSLNTENIGLASGVTSPFVRNNYVIGNSGDAISKISGGRFTFGLGVGGLPEVKKLTGERPKKPLYVLEKAVRFIKERFDLEVYLGVRGPKMLELAGRVADGVILSGPKGYIRKAVEIVDDASNGQRKVKKVLWNVFYLGKNPEKVSKITSVMLESMPEFALQDLDEERVEEELCLYGSKEEILEEINEYEKFGIDEVVVGPPYGRNTIEVIREMGG
jgi:5,10-methylenetetrahydromethanopterin reductase